MVSLQCLLQVYDSLKDSPIYACIVKSPNCIQKILSHTCVRIHRPFLLCFPRFESTNLPPQPLPLSNHNCKTLGLLKFSDISSCLRPKKYYEFLRPVKSNTSMTAYFTPCLYL